MPSSPASDISTDEHIGFVRIDHSNARWALSASATTNQIRVPD